MNTEIAVVVAKGIVAAILGLGLLGFVSGGVMLLVVWWRRRKMRRPLLNRQRYPEMAERIDEQWAEIRAIKEMGESLVFTGLMLATVGLVILAMMLMGWD